MYKKNFKILDGGKLISRKSPGLFLSAKAVTSRLMGVTGFILERDYEMFKTYEICYFDAEEYGFDTYKKFIVGCADDYEPVKSEIKKRFGGLGSTFVSITEKEAIFLMQHYANFSRKRGESLPGEIADYIKFLGIFLPFTDADRYRLFNKISKTPETDFELVNYYVMRCAGNDPEAAVFLTCHDEDSFSERKKNFKPLSFLSGKPCALLRNAVDPDSSVSGRYICESLLDYSGKFFIAISIVDTKDGIVTNSERISINQITPKEAAVITRKNCFVRIGKLHNPADDPVPVLDQLFSTALVNRHPNGILFTIFKKDNKHVQSQIFRLDNDVKAMVLITFAGELVVASSSMTDCTRVYLDIFPDNDSKNHPNQLDGEYVDSYRFAGSILPMFLDSPCFSFVEFIKLLSD